MSKRFCATWPMTMFVLSPSVETTTASASSMPAVAEHVDVHPVADDEAARPVLAEARERLFLLVDRRDVPAFAEQLPRDGRADPAAADHDRLHVIQGTSGRKLMFPAAVLLHDGPVELDPSSLSHVLDDVPVDRALVRAAEVREAAAEREVDGAVDLLVEEGVLHVTRDAGVAADAELAEAACPVVRVEHLEQVRLVRSGAGVHDAPLLEPEANPVSSRPV